MTSPRVLLSGYQGSLQEIVTDAEPKPLVARDEVGSFRVLVEDLHEAEEAG